MKYKNSPVSIHEYTTVVLERTKAQHLELRVNAIPIGIKRDFDVMCPRPRPPSTTTTDNKGNTKRNDNYDDPKFMEDIQERSDLERYFLLWCALRGSEDLVFDNEPKDLSTLKLFRQEFKSAGFTEGDSKKIIDAAMVAAGIKEDDVSEARKNF